ncbi:glycine betaine/L-proline ABC transporter substrate-binding protein ProX [Candidatus Sodalis endolongispinus]|uniref:Glycine betaine/L-proline ABC transporter substrate-binding protein ProX n=1 Tax=Candidatus Sodalis endolongispinus TaxID=2812662 RepID=A0ABS5Y9J3_9GAMM|nr:glycine betaine/L-proline ABC transporter substrate-binding protein ProX [Candidatus Sodalis endolongispinus]MBT9431667.1 glycine betaine/L-proline ABC transporter substrate-binding protein ProX [Candidatus Sodalis endolongispinus]
MRHYFIWALALTSLFARSVCAAALPGNGVVVKPVQSSLAEEAFQTELVNRALETLGYDVQPTNEVDYNVAYTAIANGDATYLAVNWKPQMEEMYDNAGGDGKFYRQGTYIAGAAQGYLIDKKTAEKYHIRTLDQLRDPKLAKLFDTDGDGKADISGCNPGWVCANVIDEQIKGFNLQATVTQNQGNYAAIIADTLARYHQGKPVLYYTWTPYWLSAELVPGRDVVWLQVPHSIYPGNQDTRLPNGSNYGFPVNNQHIVANKAWAQQNPAAAKLFAVMTLPVADANAQNRQMHQGENTPQAISRHVDSWIAAHRQQFDSWISAAEAAAD